MNRSEKMEKINALHGEWKNRDIVSSRKAGMIPAQWLSLSLLAID